MKALKKLEVSGFTWQTDQVNIECLWGKTCLFTDTLHHYNTAILRLLNQTDQEVKNWLQASFFLAKQITKKPSGFNLLTLEEKVNVLKSGWEAVHPEAKIKADHRFLKKTHIGACGHKPNLVLANSVSQNIDYAVVGCGLCNFGWLVSAKNPAKKLQDTTHYEEQYFEGGTHGLGYGHYLDQQPWRIEKAYGQIKQFKAAAEFINVNLGKNTSLLDVGSGYGYLRKAAQDAGWKADGTDLSAFAAKIAKKEYGFNTFVGLLKDFAKKSKGKLYDIIVLADVIEHVQNPVAEFALVKSLLKPKGLCMVRTPNIDSVEAKVFGNLFYSLKSEHLHYFSPKSLALFAHKACLAPKFVITQSHFFKGLLGEGILVNEAGGQGSDIFAILQNNEESF